MHPKRLNDLTDRHSEPVEGVEQHVQYGNNRTCPSSSFRLDVRQLVGWSVSA
jgi:hypothetical protein